MSDESKAERLDRELGELLQELRVALPGVQVLFAFLLTVPFSQGFAKLATFQRELYFAILLATALASILFIAPTAYHRLRWRDYDKERLLITSTRLSIVGLGVLAVAVAGAVYLIGDFLFGAGVAAAAAGVVAAALVWFWFGLPLSRKARDRSGR
jgi:phosphoglycerol transferase MdoB-like AlkP superfamily enzyme